MVATARGARLHPAWVAAAVAFVALLCAAGFRAAPGVLMVPLQEEFGWSRSVVSLAVGVNLVLFGVTAPFAAALMERFGVRAVTSVALGLIAAGSGLSAGSPGAGSWCCSGGCWSGSAPGRWPWCSRPSWPTAGSCGGAGWSWGS